MASDGVRDGSDNEPAEARFMPSAPAAWKIVLATTVVGAVVGAGGVLALAAIIFVASNPAEVSLQTVEWPVVSAVAAYVLVPGAIASLVSGLAAAWLCRKRSWLHLHHTIPIAALSCLTPLVLGLIALPFSFSLFGPSLPIVGFYAGILMLPVAIAASVISRPIIHWLLDWKRPTTA